MASRYPARPRTRSCSMPCCRWVWANWIIRPSLACSRRWQGLHWDCRGNPAGLPWADIQVRPYEWTKMKPIKRVWPSVRDYGLIAVGMLIQAVGLRLFLVPAQLASGGVSGISQLINHFTGWSIGLMVFVGNIPLLALGWRYLGGRRFAARTVFAVAVYSFLVDAVLWLPFFPQHGLTDDIVLNALYGAVLSGIGAGLVYRGQGTSGGGDILARIPHPWRGIPMAQSYLLTHPLVILSAGFVFSWPKALYALILLFLRRAGGGYGPQWGGARPTALVRALSTL